MSLKSIRIGKPFFASEKISTYRGPTPLKSHEVLALQRGANCRKSNLNVHISNDLAQVCANDAETPKRREEIGCGLIGRFVFGEQDQRIYPAPINRRTAAPA
jgi:hypothetical protein